MVSFQAHPLSPNQNKAIPAAHDSENSSKKRKWDDPFPYAEELFEKRSKPDITAKSALFDIELHLETPLPLEWQRCLDIQSGQIHFYNTRTHMKTCRDPRRSPEPPSPASNNMISLDLELNLRCESLRKNIADKPNSDHTPNTHSVLSHHDLFMEVPHRPTKSNNPSRLALEFDDHHDHQHQQQQEMVATVCMRCHMLVMLCRSSPACPNCKYMHPSDQSSPTLFKSSRLSSFMC